MSGLRGVLHHAAPQDHQRSAVSARIGFSSLRAAWGLAVSVQQYALLTYSGGDALSTVYLIMGLGYFRGLSP